MDSDQSSYAYIEALVKERRRTLQVIEDETRHGIVPERDYVSCRRALLKGVEQLEALLRDLEQRKIPKVINLNDEVAL